MLENIVLREYFSVYLLIYIMETHANDLGQPLNGKIRNICRLGQGIHRTTPRVEVLRLTKAKTLIALTLNRNKSELRAGEVP